MRIYSVVILWPTGFDQQFVASGHFDKVWDFAQTYAAIRDLDAAIFVIEDVSLWRN